MFIRLIIAAAMSCFALPLAAQEAEAVRSEIAAGDLVDRAILVTGYGQWDRDENEPLRTAQPLVEPVAWFDGTSALAAAFRADPSIMRYTTIILDVTEQGAIAGCRYEEESPAIMDEAALCADVSNQRFLPQLDNDGAPEKGRFHLRLASRTFYVESGSPARPMFTKERDNRPLPMAAPRARDIDHFPPYDFELSSLYRVPTWKSAPQAGWGDAPRDVPKTGILLYLDGGRVTCRILQSSSDKERDAVACGYGLTQLAPTWSEPGGNRDWIAPVYILHLPDDIIAIGPDPERNRDTRMSAEMDAALADALTKAGLFPQGRSASPLGLSFDSSPTGEVTHCRVVRTTGSDAQDIAACQIARKLVRMEPAEDVFGAPKTPAGMFWWAGQRP